MLSYVVGEAD